MQSAESRPGKLFWLRGGKLTSLLPRIREQLTSKRCKPTKRRGGFQNPLGKRKKIANVKLDGNCLRSCLPL